MLQVDGPAVAAECELLDDKESVIVGSQGQRVSFCDWIDSRLEDEQQLAISVVEVVP